jgi:tetratricopeptide (TPR) repeat protein
MVKKSVLKSMIVMVIIGLLLQFNLHAQPSVEYYNLGVEYSKQKNYTQAITYYKKALALDPNYYWANNNIGYVYYLIGEYSTAIPFLLKAIEIQPNNPFSYSNIGGCYVGIEEYKKAISYCQKAIDVKDRYNLNPDNGNSFYYGEPYYYMGLAYAGLKDWDKAFPYLFEAAKLGEKKAIELLNELEKEANRSPQQQSSSQQFSDQRSETLNPYVEKQYESYSMKISVEGVVIMDNYTLITFVLQTNMNMKDLWISLSSRTTLTAKNTNISYKIQEWGGIDDVQGIGNSDFDIQYSINPATYYIWMKFPKLPEGIENITIRENTGSTTEWAWEGIHINNPAKKSQSQQQKQQQSRPQQNTLKKDPNFKIE